MVKTMKREFKRHKEKMLANGKNKIKIHGNLRKSQFTKKPEEHSMKRPMN